MPLAFALLQFASDYIKSTTTDKIYDLKNDIRSVVDGDWGEFGKIGDCLPGNGWRLDTSKSSSQHWLAIHLDRQYYVQRVVYLNHPRSYPASKVSSTTYAIPRIALWTASLVLKWQ